MAEHTAKVFTQRGGFRNENFYATWPFATMTITGESIAFRVFGRNHVVGAGKIQSICTFRTLFTRGIRFDYQDHGRNRWIDYWTFDAAAVTAALFEAGFEVHEK